MRHQWFECKHRYLREKNEITQNFCPIDGTTLTESSKRSQAVYDCTLELGCVARHCRVMALKMTPLQNIYPRFQLHGLYLQSNTLRLIQTSWIFCTWLRQKVVMREIRNFPFSEEMQLSAAAALGKSSSSERTLMLSTKAYRLGQYLPKIIPLQMFPVRGPVLQRSVQLPVALCQDVSLSPPGCSVRLWGCLWSRHWQGRQVWLQSCSTFSHSCSMYLIHRQLVWQIFLTFQYKRQIQWHLRIVYMLPCPLKRTKML